MYNRFLSLYRGLDLKAVRLSVETSKQVSSGVQKGFITLILHPPHRATSEGDSLCHRPSYTPDRSADKVDRIQESASGHQALRGPHQGWRASWLQDEALTIREVWKTLHFYLMHLRQILLMAKLT